MTPRGAAHRDSDEVNSKHEGVRVALQSLH